MADVSQELSYWEEHEGFAQHALDYAREQIGRALLRGMEQLSLPIEGFAEDEQ